MSSPPATGYFRFALEHPRLLGFGFLMALGSSFGQTFFIGLFTPSIEAAFGLTHSEWGTIYMVGTLSSAALLTYTGHWIDRMRLRTYALLVCGLLTVACLSAALAPAVWFLVPMIFLLRQAGQGLASHTAVTGMVKLFRRDRGKAVAIATLGFPTGRALAPILVVSAIAAFGWRETYAGCAAVIVLLLVPAVLVLLGGGMGDTPQEAAEESRPVPAGATPSRATDASLAEVLRHPYFYLILPGLLATPVIDTALSFHLLPVADLKGWPVEWVTSGYAAFAVTTIIASMWMGKLVDRLSAARLFVWSLVPYIAGLLVLGVVDHPVGAWVYLALFGVGSGVKATLIPVMLSELYGTRHIGAIRSFAATLSVFASALGPPILGVALDLEATIPAMVGVTVLYCIVGTLMMGFAYRRHI